MKRRYSDDAPIITGHPWVWVFPQETLAARQDVRAKLDRWFELASRLIGATAPEALAEFAVHETTLRSPVSFSSDSPGPSAGTVEKATWCIQTALTDQLEVLHRVIGQLREAADLWLVPDTNALLRNPALELWQGEDPATIVLIPQVLAELDEHKMHLRRETVRRAAQKIDPTVRRVRSSGRHVHRNHGQGHSRITHLSGGDRRIASCGCVPDAA